MMNAEPASGYSILIPTWNNLPYLQLCIESIRNNSAYDHEIVVHVNEGHDGTVEWLKTENISYTHTAENAGVCIAVNQAFTKATRSLVMYMNDDMYVLPGWDKPLMEAIQEAGDELFMISATMIEPRDTGNACVINANFGDSLESFDETALQSAGLAKPDWSGASWPPVVLSRKVWEMVGGFSEEFSPGMYSDPDLSMKLWQSGCRIYRGIGESKVYHFQCKSTGKVKKNDGRRQFIKKWGISARDFYRYYLHLGGAYEGKLSSPSVSVGLLIAHLKGKLLQAIY